MIHWRLGRDRIAQILCLGFALFLWLIVSSSQQRVALFPGGIPITLENIPTGLIPLMEEEKVQVTISAEPTLWQQFNPNSFEATVDLFNAQAGLVDRPIQVTSKLNNVDILRIEPDRLLLRLEPIETKEIPIRIQIEGEPADGFATGDITISPATVQVAGAMSQLNQVTEALGKLALNGERDIVKRQIEIHLPETLDLSKTSLTLAQHEVEVTASIVRASNVKTVGVTVQTQGQLPGGKVIESLSVAPSVVTINGALGALAQTRSLTTTAIDLSNLNESKTFESTLELPAGIRLVEPPVNTVSISVELGTVGLTRSFSVPIHLTAPTAGLEIISIAPTLAEVQIHGSIDQLAKLKEDQILFELTLPVTLESGKQTLLIGKEQIKVPSGLSVVGVSPQTVVVDLGKTSN